jgi:hypothetical protein
MIGAADHGGALPSCSSAVQAWYLATLAAVAAGPRRRARPGAARRVGDPGAPQGGGGPHKGATNEQRDRREAPGRSRGGFGTKACVMADSRGRAVAFAVAPGAAHELPLAPGLLRQLPRVPFWVIGDRGYSADDFRAQIWFLGTRPAIPPKCNEAAVACPA